MTLPPSKFPLRRLGLWQAAFFLPAAALALSPLDEGTKMLEEGVAEAAIVKFQQQLASEALDPALRQEAKTKLAEAFWAAGRAEDALKQASDPEVNAPLLKARIQAAKGNWNAALAFYASAPETAQAIMGKAECLHALGRLPEAIATLENIPAKKPMAALLRLSEYYLESDQHKKSSAILAGLRDSLTPAERKWKQYIEARLLLAESDPTAAYERFEALQRDPRDATTGIIAGAAFGMTDARTILTGLTAADDILEQFIWKHPETPYLDALFRKLDEVYGGEENPSGSELEKWSKREPAIRAGYATYYLAKMLSQEKKPELAIQNLEHFSSRFPNNPIIPKALMLQGSLLANAGRFEAAQKALEEAMRASPDELRAEIEMATASAQFKAGQFVMAATLYRSAGNHNPAFAETACYNTALSWLHQANYERFEDVFKEFSQRFPNSPLRSELVLEEGLLRASRGDSKAQKALQSFVHDFPANPRVPEAWLALAEIEYTHNNAAEASRYLQIVNETPAPVKNTEQADFLAIFVADAANPPADDKVIARCRLFIDRHPTSPKIPEVRMKLGQVFFRTEDFANAQTQFETLVQEAPASPLVEQALYLAGQSSMKRIDAGGIDRAIELFSDLAARNGTLKFHARLQLALLQNRLGKEADAVKLYDDILRANPSNEIKWAAIAGKADNLFVMAEKEKDACPQALLLYEQLAKDPGIDANMRHRALYNKGRCLEKLGRPEEALAAYYDVVQSNAAKPEEYFWFYKAGFDACRLSESREQWKSAIAIYKKMASIEGPRAQEAKDRMSLLRLEHYIWD